MYVHTGVGHTDSDSSDFALNSDYYGTVEAFRNPTFFMRGGGGGGGGASDDNEEEKGDNNEEEKSDDDDEDNGDDDEDSQVERNSMTNDERKERGKRWQN